MVDVPSFDQYLATLGRLSAHIDPTASTPDAEDIKAAASSLGAIEDLTTASLSAWAQDNPSSVPVLGLAVGLSQERLKNNLRDEFDTSGWVTLARTRATELINWLDRDFDLLRLLAVQRTRTYEFGDVLVARAGTRVTLSLIHISEPTRPY